MGTDWVHFFFKSIVIPQKIEPLNEEPIQTITGRSLGTHLQKLPQEHFHAGMFFCRCLFYKKT